MGEVINDSVVLRSYLSTDLMLGTVVSLMAQDNTSRIPSESKAPDTRSISHALKPEILENERAVWDAAKTRDMQRFAELVADDVRMIFASGVITKQEYMQAVAKRTITEYSIESFRHSCPMGNRNHALRGNGGRDIEWKGVSTLQTSRKFCLGSRAGKWVAVWNQETPIP